MGVRYLFTVLALVLLVSCTSSQVAQVTTTAQRLTTTSLAATTIVTTTSTSSTTTTSFYIPLNGKLCGSLYGSNLNTVCGKSDDIVFYVLAPDQGVCTLVAKYGGVDAVFVEVFDYSKSPYRGLNPKILPVFTQKRNIAVNETGEISARYVQSNLNEIAFVQDDLLVYVKTWNDLASSDRLTCTAEQTLDFARKVMANII